MKTEEDKSVRFAIQEAAVKKSEIKSDKYLGDQMTEPIPGFIEGDIRAQENFKKILEDYQQFMSKLIGTAKERAAKARGFLACHTLYEKVFHHMNPHLQSVIQMPAQLEEDKKNAEKFRAQITLLADTVNKSQGCQKGCGVCCTENLSKRMDLVGRADRNHEILRRADLEKRKEEQTKREKELQEEIEEIKRKLQRDTHH